MPRRIVDTNLLIRQFRRLAPYVDKSPQDAARLADELIRSLDADAILTPIEIEMIAGVVDRHEMTLTEAFLDRFRIIDGRQIGPEDWKEARRIAKHVGPGADRRQLGDCLITAIAARLRYRVATEDQGMIRQDGRTRRRKPRP